MTCRDVQRSVHAFIDAELEAKQIIQLEAHLSECAECRRLVEFERWFKGELRRSVGPALAPTELPDRIRVALGRAERRDQVRVLLPKAGGFAALATGVAAALLLPGWLTPAAGGPRRDSPRPIIDCVAERHAHVLPVEVTGPDAGSVSQWFQDKVDFAVNPPAFGNGQVQLVGGRISPVGDRQAAHLLYEHRGRRVTVVVFDGSGMVLSGAHAERVGPRTVYYGESRGYPVAVWQQGGLAYAASSDLPQSDFVRLVSSVQ